MSRDVRLSDALVESEMILSAMLGLDPRVSLSPRRWIRNPEWQEGAVIAAEDRSGISLAGAETHVMIGPEVGESGSWTVWGDRDGRSGLDFFIVFVSNRPVGVLTSVAIALAVSILGEGEYWDSLYYEPVLELSTRPRKIIEKFAIKGRRDLQSASIAWIEQFEPEWAQRFR